MVIEDNFPEKFKIAAFHPSLFIYAWKRNSLDKLFEEVLQSNLAIVGGEAWKIERQKGEDWYDFVERSVKDTIEVITGRNLEKQTSAAVRNKIYYHFEFSQE